MRGLVLRRGLFWMLLTMQLFHVQGTSDGRFDTMQQFHVQGHSGIVTVGPAFALGGPLNLDYDVGDMLVFSTECCYMHGAEEWCNVCSSFRDVRSSAVYHATVLRTVAVGFSIRQLAFQAVSRGHARLVRSRHQAAASAWVSGFWWCCSIRSCQ